MQCRMCAQFWQVLQVGSSFPHRLSSEAQVLVQRLRGPDHYCPLAGLSAQGALLYIAAGVNKCYHLTIRDGLRMLAPHVTLSARCSQ